MVTGDKLAYSIEEAAVALSVSASTIHREIDKGRIRIVKLERKVIIPRKSLEELLEGTEGE